MLQAEAILIIYDQQCHKCDAIIDSISLMLNLLVFIALFAQITWIQNFPKLKTVSTINKQKLKCTVSNIQNEKNCATEVNKTQNKSQVTLLCVLILLQREAFKTGFMTSQWFTQFNTNTSERMSRLTKGEVKWINFKAKFCRLFFTQFVFSWSIRWLFEFPKRKRSGNLLAQFCNAKLLDTSIAKQFTCSYGITELITCAYSLITFCVKIMSNAQCWWIWL